MLEFKWSRWLQSPSWKKDLGWLDLDVWGTLFVGTNSEDRGIYEEFFSHLKGLQGVLLSEVIWGTGLAADTAEDEQPLCNLDCQLWPGEILLLNAGILTR